MNGLLEKGETARLETSLVYLARHKYRIARDQAVDLVQSTLLTFLEVRHRYPKSEEHVRILVGIFRNKCREHIERSVRTTKGLASIRSTAENGIADVSSVRTESTGGGGILDEIVRREDGRLILEALATLRPEAREMLRLIAEEGVSRKELMRRLGLNANTLDSRLHTYRKELKELLKRRGSKS